MKCQAPHKHTWGSIVYHNALVCGAVDSSKNHSFDNIHVRVMFTNPTHQEMLPCSYFLEHSNCKFSEEKCRYSHGEIVSLSSLKEYVEPNFENVKIGATVLAKSSDRLWYRSVVTKVGQESCTIRNEISKRDMNIPFVDVWPLGTEEEEDSSDLESEIEDSDSLIERSLLSLHTSQVLGDWEKYTKVIFVPYNFKITNRLKFQGIGSKLMQQMGYIVGTGLGKRSDGRLEPVDAVILPTGKSLDHCMQLRELSGGKDLFSTEKRLKKEQKRQEALSRKAYERQKEKTDVFEFLNKTISSTSSKKQDVRQNIKEGTNRDLNVASLKVDEDIKRVEIELVKIKESLTRHNNPKTTMHTSLQQRLASKQNELQRLHDYGKKVRFEQTLRKDKKKLTVF